ncbi:MAG TPA: thiol-disulfide isomerase [Blastocatellia bacterium]|nr:thiol-disulfide isomerase [Blastocatellia bacterium]
MKLWLKPVIAAGFAAALFISVSPTSASDKNKAGPAKGAVTFSKDVAPILNNKCAECHRPGESAPFSVLSYKDVRPWARSIKEKVVKREMPPWHADPHVGQWANDRRLTQEQIDTISAWVDQGSKEGDERETPPAPTFSDGWNIGRPDVVLEMPDEFTVDAAGPDEYQYFDIPTNFKEDRYVQMAEARPGNRKVVHHIIAFVVPPGNPSLNQVPKEMRDKALEMSLKNTPYYRDGFLIRMKADQPVYNDSGDVPANLRGFNNVDDFLTAYAPGSNYGAWEPGTAKRIPAGAVIRFQVHYSKVAGSVQKDRSMVGLVFAKEPPASLRRTRAVANMFFQIPPETDNHKVTAAWTPKNDITIYSFMPHMHYRGKAMEIKVTYPNGRTEPLLNVPNYSFAWQTAYQPKAPIRIPGGSRIVVTGYFDNTARNKFNPDPAKTVRYGEPTYDEMMMGFMDYVVEKPSGLAKVDPRVFEAYVGQYALAGNDRTYSISTDGKRYFGQATGNPKRELFPVSDVKFMVPEIEAQITFVKDEKGEVVELVYERNDGQVQYKKVKDVTAIKK